MPLDPELFSLLACPRCHGPLTEIESPPGLACETCKRFFAIEDRLPNLLIDEAQPWPLHEASRNPAV